MERAGSGHPAGPTILAGTPATVVLSGTSCSTTLPAATREQLPTVILPRIVAPAPTNTLQPIFGWRSPPTLPLPPSVTPCRNEQLSPTTAVSPTTKPVA